MLTFAPMNCDDEITKRKRYYDGLKQVIENPIRRNQFGCVPSLLLGLVRRLLDEGAQLDRPDSRPSHSQRFD